MSETEILKEQIKALEKLVELKDQVIKQLQQSQYITYPYTPFIPYSPYYGQGITITSGTTSDSAIKLVNVK